LKSRKKHNTPASEKFDRELFTLKLSELSDQMQARIVSSARDAGMPPFETDGLVLLNIVDHQLALALLREWLEGIDRICREVWQIQREALTPEFARDVLVPAAMTLIRPQEAKAKSDLADVVSQMSPCELPRLATLKSRRHYLFS
jgi:hypothetical protein